MKCPKCKKSENLEVERRPNGNAKCSCGWSGPYAECFKESTVSVPHMEEDSLKLGVDSDCSLYISGSNIKGVVLLTMEDGGGFTGFLMSHKEWPEIRAKIDAYIEKKNGLEN